MIDFLSSADINVWWDETARSTCLAAWLQTVSKRETVFIFSNWCRWPRCTWYSIITITISRSNIAIQILRTLVRNSWITCSSRIYCFRNIISFYFNLSQVKEPNNKFNILYIMYYGCDIPLNITVTEVMWWQHAYLEIVGLIFY